jgi:Peptidase family M28
VEKLFFGLLALLFLPSPALPQAKPGAAPQRDTPILCNRCIEADMNFLASDELRGRGSATRDEHIAALFAAAQFASLGLEPGGDNGSFLQKAALPNPLPDTALKSLRLYEKTPRTQTWNVVGILRGTEIAAKEQAILLTAHLDHLGTGPVVNGDAIYNGADDDASGVTAVIELARVFAHRVRQRRTILFVLFGSEEIGGLGNQYFLKHPPFPLLHIVANLEFEMIGRPDPLIPPDGLWLTGYERSSLGPELVKHGAKIVADPRPGEDFFCRSDNYALARSGVVAHTISSFSLHADYHHPSDDLAHIDFTHMADVISGMIEPIRWLASTTWRPTWNPGGKP